MNVDTFLGNFATVVNAPKGLDQVRSLILRLAIQGRLVPPGREDASELLRELREIRNVATSKKKRGAAALPTRVPNELGFQIPQHWRWAQFGELGNWGAGATPNRADKSYYGGKMPWYKSGELNDGVLDTAEEFITEKALKACSLRINEPGDVLVAMYGATIGKVGIASVQCTTNQAVCACTPFEGVFNRYLLILLKAMKPWFIANAAGAAQPNYSKDKIIRTSAPLPPLEEQKRIVAKVDELMRLCDRLQAQQQEREKLLPLLSRANHTRFVAEPTEANLRAIFHTEGVVSPEELTNTILKLAVQGHLTAVDPVARAADDFPILIDKDLPSTRSFPSNWLCVRLCDLGDFMGGGTPSKASSQYWAGTIPWVSPKDMKTPQIFDAVDHITDEAIQNSSTRLIPKGSILVVVRGMILIHTFPVAVAGRELTINQDMKAIVPVYPETSDFILLALQAFESDILEMVERSSHGTCKLLTNRLQAFVIPVPPLSEQRRILALANNFLARIKTLTALQAIRLETASLFAKAAVAAITSTDFTENERMKPPKTEVVTALKVGKKPKKPDAAPLATLLSEQKAEASAKSLWQISGLEIDAFYQQLKTEMANGWIEEDKHKRAVQEVEAR